VKSALFWVIMQTVVVISYRRFGTTYRSRNPDSRWPLIFGLISCPERSVRNYHYCLRSYHLLRGGNLKLRVSMNVFVIHEFVVPFLLVLFDKIEYTTKMYYKPKIYFF